MKTSEKLLPSLTFCMWFVRQDLVDIKNGINTKPIPEAVKMLWSIVSNAAERSSNVRATALPEYIEAAMSLWILRRAVSVECGLL